MTDPIFHFPFFISFMQPLNRFEAADPVSRIAGEFYLKSTAETGIACSEFILDRGRTEMRLAADGSRRRLRPEGPRALGGRACAGA